MDTLLDARRSLPTSPDEVETRRAAMTELPSARPAGTRIPTLVDVSTTRRPIRAPSVSVPTRSLQRLHRLQTASRHVQRDLLTVLAWGSVAAALGRWVADGGLQAVTSGAKVLLAAGIITGLVATDLMVIMLILAAAWSAATLGGQTAVGAPAVATDPTSLTSDNPSAAAAATTKATTAAPASGFKDGTFAGPTVTHQYGSVTVSITVSGGKITAVATTTTSVDSKSTSITSSAVPTLKSRVISAQSGSVSTVSGATYTSKAFISSVQAAVTKAKA